MRGRLFVGSGADSEPVEISALSAHLVVAPRDRPEFSLPFADAQIELAGDRGSFILFRFVPGEEGGERYEVWVEREGIVWHLEQSGAPPPMVTYIRSLLSDDNRWKGLEMLGLIGCGGAFFVLPCLWGAVKFGLFALLGF